MKAFICRKLSAKGFLSETSILGTNFWPKKWQKAHISAGSRNLKKLKKCDPLGPAIFASLSILRMNLTYVMPFGSLMKCI